MRVLVFRIDGQNQGRESRIEQFGHFAGMVLFLLETFDIDAIRVITKVENRGYDKKHRRAERCNEL